MILPFPQMAARIFDQPHAIHPAKAEIILAALSNRLGIQSLTRADGSTIVFSPRASDDDEIGFGLEAAAAPKKGYDVDRGIAIITVQGILLQRTGTLRPFSGLTGYDGLRQNLLDALDDKSVKAIVFDMDTPGGEVAGCFDLVDTIYHCRGVKPIWAILSENAYSAGYAIASACDRIIVPRTGGVGSIGVIGMHVSYAGMLEKAGVQVSLITYGAHKADGAESNPLSDSARKRAQADIDTMGALFDATVARNRRMAAARVKALEAATFLGKAGVSVGLADAVMAPQEAFAALLKSLK